MHCRRFVYLTSATRHAAAAAACLAAVCVRDMQLLSEKLLQGGQSQMSPKDGCRSTGCRAEILKGSNFLTVVQISKKCWNANEDHSAQCVEVSTSRCFYGGAAGTNFSRTVE